MTIDELAKEAHGNAIEKGFYDCPECGGSGKLNVRCSDEPDIMICPKCNGTGINQNKNIPELLMLIVSEIGEAVEALREDRRTAAGALDHYSNIDMVIYYKNYEKYIKYTFEDEIADTFIRLADLCGFLEIDIEKHIIAKTEYNKTREYKHGMFGENLK